MLRFCEDNRKKSLGGQTERCKNYGFRSKALVLCFLIIGLSGCGAGGSGSGGETTGGGAGNSSGSGGPVVDVAPTFLTMPPSLSVMGTEYSYDFSVQDENSEQLNFQLITSPEGMVLDEETRRITWDYSNAEPGDHIVTIQVSDSAGHSAAQRFTLTVPEPDDEPVNLPPAFLTSPMNELAEGETFSYQLSVVDPDGVEPEIDVEQIPDGAVYSASEKLITWTPSFSQAGEHILRVTLTDSQGAVTAQEATITVINVNRAPAFISEALEDALEGELYEYAFNAEDEDGDALSFFLVSGPDGMAVNSDGTALVWRPGYNEAGQYDVDILVTDPAGLRSNQRFELTVANNNRAPNFTSSADREVNEGSVYEYIVSGSDPDGDAMTFNLLQGPNGMLLSDDGVTITWAPDFNSAGEYDIDIMLSDSAGLTAIQSFVLTVDDSNRAPVISTAPSTSITEGDLYLYEIEASDPDGDGLRYELVTAPSDATLLSDGGTALLSWNPDFDSAGDVEMRLLVIDEKGFEVEHEFVLSVENQNRAPVVSSSPELGVVEGDAYLYQLVLSDPDDDALTIELVDGPDNMILNTGDQRLEWTPSSEQVSTHDVVLRVSDESGEFVLQEFTVTVNDAPLVYLVEWDRPTTTKTGASIESTDISGYEVAYRKVGDAEFTREIVDGGGTDSYEIEVPVVGSYEITLVAVGMDGLVSDYSDPVVVQIN